MSEDQLPPQPPESAPPPPPSSPPPPSLGGGSNGGGKVSENRTVMIVLAYLWILALIPYLVEKEDQEVQWHAKQGLVLTVAEFILWVALTIVNFVIGAIFAPLSCIVSIGFLALWIGLIVLHVVCIVQGTSGKRLLIPGLSHYTDRF